jgi:hypothetical protein
MFRSLNYLRLRIGAFLKSGVPLVCPLGHAPTLPTNIRRGLKYLDITTVQKEGLIIWG